MPDEAPEIAPEDRMYPEDVQELLGKDANGKYRYSRWWVIHNVAPEAKRRLGKYSVWPRKAVLSWLAAQMR